MLGLLIGTLCAAMLLSIMGWVAWNVVNDALRIGLVEQDFGWEVEDGDDD